MSLTWAVTWSCPVEDHDHRKLSELLECRRTR